MAPTICPGKKRQTRTIATTNIRRHGQGTQLNQAISNIVNFVDKGPLNPKAPAFLRTQIHSHHMARNPNATSNCRSTNDEGDLNYRLLMHGRASSASNHHLQYSDNAVTSSELSDTENSLDLRLAQEILSIDSTVTHGSNSTDTSNNSSHITSPLSEPTSLSSPKDKTSLSTLECQERLYQRYSAVMQANDLSGDEESADTSSERDDVCEENVNNKLDINKKKSELHSSNKRKYYLSFNDPESDEDDLESIRDFNSEMSDISSETNMETYDSDSTTSLNTEKVLKLKRGNHVILRDTFGVKQLNKKTSTDGLLSIAIKTIKLVKRNQLLQERLSQLQVETSEFIQSVLSNPENQHFRENIEQKV